MNSLSFSLPCENPLLPQEPENIVVEEFLAGDFVGEITFVQVKTGFPLLTLAVFPSRRWQ